MARNHVVVFSSRGQHPDDFEEALEPGYFGFRPTDADGELDVDYVIHRDSSGGIHMRPIGDLHEDRVVIMVLGNFHRGHRHSRQLSREEAEAIAEVVGQLQDREELDSDCSWTVDLGEDVPADEPPPVEDAGTPVQDVPVAVPENPIGNQPDDPPVVVVPPEPTPEEAPVEGGEAAPEPTAPEPEPGPSSSGDAPSEPSPPPAEPGEVPADVPQPVPADGTQDGGTPNVEAPPFDPNTPPETANQP